MNEWKELQIDNLPTDILTGDYEWEIFNNLFKWSIAHGEGSHILSLIISKINCGEEPYRYRYRKPEPKCTCEGWEKNRSNKPYCPYCDTYMQKPEPKQPTHKEIMTKWWLSSSLWVKVMSYDRDEKKYETPINYEYYDWFIGRESADIPPEGPKV